MVFSGLLIVEEETPSNYENNAFDRETITLKNPC